MKTIREYKLGQLFSSLRDQEYEGHERTRLWFARARDLIILSLGENSSFVGLLDLDPETFDEAAHDEGRERAFSRAKAANNPHPVEKLIGYKFGQPVG